MTHTAAPVSNLQQLQHPAVLPACTTTTALVVVFWWWWCRWRRQCSAQQISLQARGCSIDPAFMQGPFRSLVLSFVLRGVVCVTYLGLCILLHPASGWHGWCNFAKFAGCKSLMSHMVKFTKRIYISCVAISMCPSSRVCAANTCARCMYQVARLVRPCHVCWL